MIRLILALALVAWASTAEAVSPAFRALSAVTPATATDVTGTEPAGAAENDILRADLYIESDTAVTAPSGWSNTFRSTTALVENNTASHAYRHYAYWIRRGAAAPALTWSFTSSFRALVIVAYSGAVTTEQPWSFATLAQRDDTTAQTWPAVSGTTLTADELLVWVGEFFTSGIATATQPTGFTERQDAVVGSQAEVADLAQAAAGSTGSVTGGVWTGGAGNDTASVIFAGLKSVAEAGGAAIPQRTMTGVGL